MRVPLLLMLFAICSEFSVQAARPIYTLPGVDYPRVVTFPVGTPPGAMAPLVPPGGITVPTGDPAGDPAGEIAGDLEQYSQHMDSLNQLNPASEQFGKMMGGGSPLLGDSTDPIGKLLTNSSAQKWIEVASDPKLRESALAIAQSPRRKTLFYLEIGLFLTLVVFRAWRFSKVTKWNRRLWVSAYSLGLYWLGAVCLMPWLVLGEDYRRLALGLIRIFGR